MTPDEMNARLAAMAMQVARLHTALRAANHGTTYTTAVQHQIDAALNTSESECGELVELARVIATNVLDKKAYVGEQAGPSEDAFEAAGKLLDRLARVES